MTSYNIIASGSSGNAIIYHEEILVDAGVAYAHIKPFLADIKYLLLTHRHGDHFNISTITTLAVEYPEIDIIGNEDVIGILKDLGVKNTHVINSNEWYNLGKYTIATVDVQHNVPNIAYRILKPIFKTRIGASEPSYIRDHKIFHATDMGHLDDVEAYDYDLYMIENNYCEIKINKAIAKKRKLKKYSHEIRTLQDHFSNQQTKEWLAKNNVDGTVVWLHISDDYGVVERKTNVHANNNAKTNKAE